MAARGSRKVARVERSSKDELADLTRGVSSVRLHSSTAKSLDAARIPAHRPVKPSKTIKAKSGSSTRIFLPFFRPRSPIPTKKINCAVCLTPRLRSSITSLPCCKAKWCSACLEHAFRAALAAPGPLTPPRCACATPIAPAAVQHVFRRDAVFQTQWNRRLDRADCEKTGVYCARRRCGRWISPGRIHTPRKGCREHAETGGRGRAECARCRALTCTACRGRWHAGRTCPTSCGEQAFAALVTEQGWQQCPGCGRVVERVDGCNHMRCGAGCGAEFCYRCGQPWRLLHACLANGEEEEAEERVNVFDYLVMEGGEGRKEVLQT